VSKGRRENVPEDPEPPVRITRTSLALLGVAAMTVAAVPALGGDDGVT
jgi:hypothetical protein